MSQGPLRRSSGTKLPFDRAVGLGALAFWAATATWSSPSAAQLAQQGVDAVALPMPISPTRFSLVESSSPSAAWTPSAGGRLSGLGLPVALGLPSPSGGATNSAAVRGLINAELVAAVGLPFGFDAGVGLSVRAYQWGNGLAPVSGGSTLSPTAFADPRVSLGWGLALGDFSLRPHVQLFVPLGEADAFAGEGQARADLGLAAGYQGTRVQIGVDVGVRLRQARELGYTRLGSQLNLAAGVLFTLVERLQLGPELSLQPTFSEQLTPTDGEPPRLLPAQARGTLRWAFEDHVLLASAGAGLPLSQASSLGYGAWQRGVTSPSLFLAVEFRTSF